MRIDILVRQIIANIGEKINITDEDSKGINKQLFIFAHWNALTSFLFWKHLTFDT